MAIFLLQKQQNIGDHHIVPIPTEPLATIQLERGEQLRRWQEGKHIHNIGSRECTSSNLNQRLLFYGIFIIDSEDNFNAQREDFSTR